MVIGVAFMLMGMVLLGIAFADSRNDDEVASGSSSTTTTEVQALPPGLPPGTTAPLEGEPLGSGVASERDGRAPLRGFGEVAATITTGTGKVCRVCLLSAVSVAQREHGLMGVTDPLLGGYDGMLFEFPGEVEGSFWMRNTPQPLSIAYFDAAGDLVSTTNMRPCGDDPTCPGYPADGPFRFALEVPQGRLPDVGVVGAATLRIDGRTCPKATPGG